LSESSKHKSHDVIQLRSTEESDVLKQQKSILLIIAWHMQKTFDVKMKSKEKRFSEMISPVKFLLPIVYRRNDFD
jgi:hypothetical protein